ncbi:DUF6114 domain-containing protein [Kitasatospora viridis]|uniref:Uncharacterized protein n=1 Tax=Kitasatospora viridis TaxID=281105 RepID=A0A561TWS5_9ACTN|nr:DUF6114 domain-containing protein [Kitasatospora viridis]TWF91576.1 hypothetical protein FHX73_12692 [Kitasatospora viridis]
MLTATARGVRAGRRWFRAFRRTRPFWGSLWLVLGGWTVLKFSLGAIRLVTVTGFDALAGYLVGGGMMLCGLIPLALPRQRYNTFGLLGTVLAVVSLVVSNLGGFLLGMLLVVLGGAMIVGWGPRRRRRAQGRAGPGREREREVLRPAAGADCSAWQGCSACWSRSPCCPARTRRPRTPPPRLCCPASRLRSACRSCRHRNPCT